MYENHDEKPILQLPYILSVRSLKIGSIGQYNEVLPGRTITETRIVTKISLFFGYLYLRVNPVLCIDSSLAYLYADPTRILYNEDEDKWYFLTKKSRLVSGVTFVLGMKPVYRTVVRNTNVIEDNGKLII